MAGWSEGHLQEESQHGRQGRKLESEAEPHKTKYAASFRDLVRIRARAALRSRRNIGISSVIPSPQAKDLLCCAFIEKTRKWQRGAPSGECRTQPNCVRAEATAEPILPLRLRACPEVAAEG